MMLSTLFCLQNTISFEIDIPIVIFSIFQFFNFEFLLCFMLEFLYIGFTWGMNWMMIFESLILVVFFWHWNTTWLWTSFIMSIFARVEIFGVLAYVWKLLLSGSLFDFFGYTTSNSFNLLISLRKWRHIPFLPFFGLFLWFWLFFESCMFSITTIIRLA